MTKLKVKNKSVGDLSKEVAIGISTIRIWALIIEITKIPIESKMTSITAMVKKDIGCIPIVCLTML